MPEQIQKILERVLEWWKKFNNKQRVLIISITAVVLLSLGILAFAVSRPTMVNLVVCDDLKQASEVNNLLQSDSSIDYDVSSDGLIFQVDVRDEAKANYLLAENGIPTKGYDIDNVTNGSLSTTEADKEKKYRYYLEQKFASDLSGLDNIESAIVSITLPDNDGTILSKEQEGTASVKITPSRDLSDEQIYGIARFVATELGNETTNGITIIDNKSNLLYSGADSNSSFSAVSSQLNAKMKQESQVSQKVESVLRDSGMYADVKASANLVFDFSDVDEATHEWYTPDGSATGPVTSQSTYDAEADGTNAEIPGTDNNDDTPNYMLENGEYGSWTVSQTDTNYATSERITNRKNSGGELQYEASSITVVATRTVLYSEEQLEATGQLNDMTYEEFKAVNSGVREVETAQEDIEAVSNITGIPMENITFRTYESPEFVEAGSGRALSDILQIVLAVLIFAMLAFVVFRSTRKQPEPEPEPELSVEALLESTAEQDLLDDIGYSEKSEVRVLIEKFVDENPDAVAMLLRNWLNEDWE